MKKLVIIGNGFDIAHCLPTQPNLIIQQGEFSYWGYYNGDKWSGYESDLANPDIDSILEYLSSYAPDYASDRESDRDAIITEVDRVPSVHDFLENFLCNASDALCNAKPINKYTELFNSDDLFISFNYLDTLEMLYNISRKRILYIHGKFRDDKLHFGHGEKVDFGEVFVDVHKGRGHCIDAKEYLLNERQDYYYYAANSMLVANIEANKKEIQLDKLESFIQELTISEIVTIGYSFGEVDAPYFEMLSDFFPNARIIATGYKKSVIEEMKNNICEYYNLKIFLMKCFKESFLIFPETIK